MIIWFDNNMVMHVDKKHDASNSFALAKYVPEGYDTNNVTFKANAVVSGHILLLTDPQVTYYAKRSLNNCYDCCSSTARKYFFKNYLSTIEKAIANNLRNDKKYKGDIKLRFRIGRASSKLFDGYIFVNSEWTYNRFGEPYAEYLILEKSI